MMVRRRRGRTVVVAALVVGVVASALLVVDGEDRPTASAGSTATKRPAVDPIRARWVAIERLLASRARAIMAGDKTAFLGQIAASQVEFSHRQAVVFDRLRQLPLASWEYEYAGDGPPLSLGAARTLPPRSFVAKVLTRYRFAGSTSAAESEGFLTFAPTAGGWRVVGDRQAEAAGVPGVRAIWELGPIKVVRGRHHLVIGSAGNDDLGGIAAATDQAVRDVAAVLAKYAPPRPVVLLPRTQRDMARILGVPSRQVAQIAAATVGDGLSWGVPLGDRVVINPTVWSRYGPLSRRELLAHEITHLATRTSGKERLPLWLSEGLAEYVANEAIDAPTSLVAAELLRRVAEGKIPAELPDLAEFHAGGARTRRAYQGAWLACRLIAETYGEKRLVRVYRTVATEYGALYQQLKETIGLTQFELEAKWRRYLRQLAAG